MSEFVNGFYGMKEVRGTMGDLMDAANRTGDTASKDFIRKCFQDWCQKTGKTRGTRRQSWNGVRYHSQRMCLNEGGNTVIAYLCNKCHKPLDLKDEENIHLNITLGERGITSEGRYGSGWSADLCSACAKELNPYIGEYYYGGGMFVEKKEG